MDGASSGQGAAWPLPHIINAAFHAALHRAEITDVHLHKQERRKADTRDQKFGCLNTIGPFPVRSKDGAWFFPRPLDAGLRSSSETTYEPRAPIGSSSLPGDLLPVMNKRTPRKETAEAWMSRTAYEAYLAGAKAETTSNHFLDDADVFHAEHNIGIGIDNTRDATKEGAFYSAAYLRLKQGWELGACAVANDKIDGDKHNRRDLIEDLIQPESRLLVGGQQRTCTARLAEESELCLPRAQKIQGGRVRFTLLTPAVFPEIHKGKDSDRKLIHHGGWLPNWIDPETLEVQLLDGLGIAKAKRLGKEPGKPIRAKLVSALVGRPVPVTGWALGLSSGRSDKGPKSTHLATPAGSVYYFEALGDTKEEKQAQASKLATTLNWHGSDPDASQVLNRRSTLYGEKGFGLGLCSPWTPAS